MEEQTEIVPVFAKGQLIEVLDGSGRVIQYGHVRRLTGEKKPRCFIDTDGSSLVWGMRYPRDQFSAVTGKQIGGPLLIQAISTVRHAELEKENEKRLEEKAAKDEHRRQAEYDALPEEVKLARKLAGFFDYGGTEAKVATMPLDILRAAVKWIEENGYECQ